MYISDILRRSGRSLRQAKIRTLLTASAIGVGTFALTLTLAASNGAQSFVNNIITDNFDPAELIVVKDETILGRGDNTRPKEYDPSYSASLSEAGASIQVKKITDEDITKIKSLPEVELVRQDIQLNLQYLTRAGQKKFVGTAQALNPAQKPDLLAGNIPKPLGDDQIILPEGYLSALGFKDAQEAVGKPIVLAVGRSVNPLSVLGAQPQSPEVTETEFKIVAVTKKPVTAQPGTELYLFTSDAATLKLNDIATLGSSEYHKYTSVNVRVKDGQDKAKIKAAQEKLTNLGYASQSMEETQKFLTQILDVLKAIVAGFGAIAVVASLFGIINTMYISVLQRTREIGLMKALGMRKRDIGRLFRFEAAWIGFLGGIIGSLSAFLLGAILNPWITEKLALGEGNDLLIFRFPQIAGLVLILMLVATIAGLLPSRKAAKLDPIEALRTE